MTPITNELIAEIIRRLVASLNKRRNYSVNVPMLGEHPISIATWIYASFYRMTFQNLTASNGVSQTIDKNGQPSSEGIVGCRGSKKQGCPFLSRFSPREYEH
jgi:hypothetical protein